MKAKVLICEVNASPKHGGWAIDIKRGLVARSERGFHNARVDVKPNRSFVVYGGEEHYPISEGVEAIGLKELASVLTGL